MLPAWTNRLKLLTRQDIRRSQVLQERRHLEGLFYKLWVLTMTKPVSCKWVAAAIKGSTVSENKL